MSPTIDQPVSSTVLDLPRSHWHCSLRNFDWSEWSKGDIEKVMGWMDDTRARRAPHLLLVGNIGTGKTHIGVALYRWAVYVSELEAIPADSAFIHVDTLLGQLAASHFPSDQEEVWADVEDVRFCAVLDDLFGSQYNDRRLQYIARLIDTLHRNGAALVVTSNIAAEKWLDRGMAAHERSRLLENARGVQFAGRDRRVR